MPSGCASLLAVVSLTIVGFTAGCSSSGTDAQSLPTATDPPTPVSSSISPSRLPQTLSQKAGAQAAARVAAYERTLDDLFLHPRLSINRLYTVSTQPDVDDEIGDLNRFREARDRQAGRVEVLATKVDSVDLADKPHARKPVYPTARVTACIKVGGVQAYGRNGKSIVPRSRKPYLLTHLAMVNPKFPMPNGWLVSSVTNTEERSCGA